MPSRAHHSTAVNVQPKSWTSFSTTLSFTSRRPVDCHLPVWVALKGLGQGLMSPDLPEGREVVVRALTGELDQGTSNYQRDPRWPSAPASIGEGREGRVLSEPRLPLAHGALVATSAVRHGLSGVSLGREDDDPCPLHQPMPGLGEMSETFQNGALILWYSQWIWLRASCHVGSDRGSVQIIQTETRIELPG